MSSLVVDNVGVNLEVCYGIILGVLKFWTLEFGIWNFGFVLDVF
jgi:hypothetical protein